MEPPDDRVLFHAFFKEAWIDPTGPVFVIETRLDDTLTDIVQVMPVDQAVLLAKTIIDRWHMIAQCGWCGGHPVGVEFGADGEAYPYCRDHESDVRSLIDQGGF